MADRQLMRLLLVVADGVYRYALSVTLQREGYIVAEAASGEAALDAYDRREHDVVIVEVDLPGMSGLELLRGVKNQSPDSVVILMAAQPSVASAVQAMRAGASDYLTIPCSSDELRASVERAMSAARSMLRRRRLLDAIERNVADLARETAGNTRADSAATVSLSDLRPLPTPAGAGIQLGPLTVSPGRHEVAVGGASASLTPTEFDLLMYLAAHRERVVPCQELVSEVRGYHVDEPEAREVMRPHISHLRRKLKRLHDADIIVNVRGVGYRLRESAETD